MAMTPAIVPDLLRDRARDAPDAVACLVDGRGELTFLEWEERSNALARGLVGRGVTPGDRVVLRFDSGTWNDLAVSYFGVLKAGGVAVPLSDSLAPAELHDLLSRCAPVGVLGASHLLPEGGAHWTAEPHTLAAGQSAAPVPAAAGPRAPADIIYTSGTTGPARGVVSTHEHLLCLHAAQQALPALRMPDGGQVTVVHAMPVGTTATMQLLFVPLVIGWSVLTLTGFDPARFCALVESHRAAVAVVVPMMATALLDSGASRSHDLSSLRILASGSAVMPASTLERLQQALPDTLLLNAYGLTETGGAGTAMFYDASRPTSIGVPRQDSVRVAVCGPGGEALPAGAVGEIALRMEPAGTRWYFRDPEATASVFQDGWVRTGDLGYLDSDGYLHLVDRVKDVVITAGVKVSTLEVEAALMEHPAVRDAAVVGERHPVLGEQVVAVVVPRTEVSEAELQRFLDGRLSVTRRPRRIVFVGELPRDAAGKVRKGAVRGLVRAPEPPVAKRSPATSSEARLLDVWRELFQRQDIGVDDDFFSLGGHSLLALRLLDTIKTTFGVELDPAAALEHPTVAELARAIDAAGVRGTVRETPALRERRPGDPAVALYDPADPAFRADPYPAYRRLRELEPVHQSPLGFWALSRYVDVVAALRDERFVPATLHGDPARQRRLRAAVGGYFTPDPVAALCGHVAVIARETLQPLAGQDTIDVIADYAKPVASRMLAGILGTSPAEQAAQRRWLETAPPGGAPGGGAGEGGLDASRRSLEDMVTERRRRGGDDLVSWLLAGGVDGGPFGDKEIVAFVGSLARGSYDGTWGLVANGLLGLLRHPDQLGLLREDPSLITGAIEELARYDGPIQVEERRLLDDAEVLDCTIPKGSRVALLLGAANRDSDRFRDPDRVDLTRPDPGSASFAPGADCFLGTRLARLAAEVALLVLLDRFASLGPVVGPLRWRQDTARRELAALPVRVRSDA